MDTPTESALYNEAIILSELERRFYLYLIGGDYEKMFYSVDGVAAEHEQGASESISMSGIHTDGEISQQQRLNQVCAGYPDPAYKAQLDCLLAKRINDCLENQDDLIATCPPVKDLQLILSSFGKYSEFDDALFEQIEAIPWLIGQIKRFAKSAEFQLLLTQPKSTNVRDILTSLGYPLFIWLLPQFISEVLHSGTHVSLRPLIARVRQYGSLTSGAIATLMVDQQTDRQNKWMTYMLAGINMVPLFLLINLVNSELKKLLNEQRTVLKNSSQHQADRLWVIDNYQYSNDMLRDLLCLEEILKPHILEEIGFEHFDPLPYLLGYADDTSPFADIFFQARAYAFYRQLFKTGRILPQETAIFLRKYRIDKSMLRKLDEHELTSTKSHVKLHQKLVNTHQQKR